MAKKKEKTKNVKPEVPLDVQQSIKPPEEQPQDEEK